MIYILCGSGCFCFFVFGFFSFGVCLNEIEISFDWREDGYGWDNEEVLCYKLNVEWYRWKDLC